MEFHTGPKVIKDVSDLTEADLQEIDKNAGDDISTVPDFATFDLPGSRTISVATIRSNSAFFTEKIERTIKYN